MSGTSFGTCLLHVSPEAAVGGPLALVENGDLISLDVPAGRLDLLISPKELENVGTIGFHQNQSTFEGGQPFTKSMSCNQT